MKKLLALKAGLLLAIAAYSQCNVTNNLIQSFTTFPAYNGGLNSQTSYDCWDFYPSLNSNNHGWSAGGVNLTAAGVSNEPKFDNSLYGVLYGEYLYVQSSFLGDTASATSPFVDLTGITNPVVRFFVHRNGTNVPPLIVKARTFSGYWTTIGTFSTTIQGSVNDPFVVISLPLTAFAGQQTQIKFQVPNTPVNLTVALDDIYIGQDYFCVSSPNTTLTPTPNGVDVSWDPILGAQDYQVVAITEQGLPNIASPTITTTSTSASIPFNYNDIGYKTYFRYRCDSTLLYSEWHYCGITYLGCSPKANSYMWHFSTPMLNDSMYNNCSRILPDPIHPTTTWKYADGGGVDQNTLFTGPSNGAQNYAGYMFLEATGGQLNDTSSLLLEPYDLAGMTGPALQFYYHMYGRTMGKLEIYARGNNNSWTLLFEESGQQQTQSTAAWKLKQLPIPDRFGDTIHLKIKGHRGAGTYSDMAIDNISVISDPCVSPKLITMRTLPGNQLQLKWNSTGTHSIYYAPCGTTPLGGGTLVSGLVDSTQFSLTSLPSCVEFYISRNCAGITNWSGPFRFEIPRSLPLEESFDHGLPPAWTEARGPMGLANYLTYLDDTTAHFGDWHTATDTCRMNVLRGGDVNAYWLISPLVHLDASSPSVVEFDLTLRTSYGPQTLQAGDSILVMVVPEDSVLKRRYIIRRYSIVNSPGGQGNHEVLNLDSLDGDYRVVVHMVSSNTAWLEAFVNNFYWHEGPCENVKGFAVSLIQDQQITVSWNNWAKLELEYGYLGFAPGTGAKIVVEGTGASIPFTHNFNSVGIRFRQICGLDTAQFSSQVKAVCTCLPNEPPFTDGFEHQSTNRFPPCWKFFPALSPGFSYFHQNIQSPTTTSAGQSHNGNGFLEMDFGFSNTERISYPIALKANINYNLKFWAKSVGSSTLGNTIKIGTSNTLPTGTTIASNWVVNASGYTQHVFPFTVPTDSIYYIYFESNNSSQHLYVDDFAVEFDAAVCMEQVVPSVTYQSTTTLGLSWTGFQTADSVEINYGVGSFGPGAGLSTMGTSDYVAVASLQPGTCYTYYLRSYCSAASAPTAWVGPFTACTSCEGIDAPYLQDFGTLASANLGCFVPFTSFKSVDLPTIETPQMFNGSVRLHHVFGGANAFSGVISPALNQAGTQNYRVRFTAWSPTPGVQVGAGTTANQKERLNFTYLDTFNLTPFPQEFLVRLDQANGYNLTDPFLVLHGLGLAAGQNIYIDNFVYEADSGCLHPLQVVATERTATTISISWVGSSLVEGQLGVLPDQGTSFLLQGNADSLTGLSPNTPYTLWLRSICGGDTSSWSGPHVFRTACERLFAPVYFDFEAEYPGNNGLLNNCFTSSASDHAYGFGWTSEDASGNDEYRLTTGPWYDNSNYPTPGGNYVFINSAMLPFWTSDSSSITSPEIDLSALNQPQLGFALHRYGAQIGSVRLDIHRDGGWVNGVWSSIGGTLSSGSSAWDQILLPLATGSGSVIKLRFVVKNNGLFGEVALDDISVNDVSPCAVPFGLSAETVAGGIALGWQDTVGLGPWEVVFAPQGQLGLNDSIVVVATDSLFLSGLSAPEEYVFQVRSSCGLNQYSNWSNSFSFVGVCPSLADSLLYTFTGELNGAQATLRNCFVALPSSASTYSWRVHAATGIDDLTTGTGPAFDNDLQNTAGGSYVYTEASFGNANDTAVLMTPWFDGAAFANPLLEFAYFARGAHLPEVEIWINDGASWSLVDTLGSYFQLNADEPWMKHYTVLPGGGNNFRIKFLARKGNGPLGDFALDQIKVSNGGGCADLSLFSGSIQSTNLQLSWTSTMVPSAWQINWYPVGQNSTGAQSAVVTGTQAAVGPIDPSKKYWVTIQPSCGGSSLIFGPYLLSGSDVYCEDFEDFNTGNLEAQSNFIQSYTVNSTVQSGLANPTGKFWSISPGATSYSILDSVASGQWSIALDVNLDPGTTGKTFYILSHVNAGGKGVRIEMQPNGELNYYRMSNGNLLGTYQIATNQWVHLEHLIDFDNQWGHVYVNGNYINLSWPLTGVTTNLEGFRVENASTTPLLVDNFCMAPKTICLPQSDVPQPFSPACNVVDLNFANHYSTRYIEYGPAGFTPGTGTAYYLTTNDLLTGLSPLTTFDVYYQDSCRLAAGEPLHGPVSFDSPSQSPPSTPAWTAVTLNSTTAWYIVQFTGSDPSLSYTWQLVGGNLYIGQTVLISFTPGVTTQLVVTATNDCGSTSTQTGITLGTDGENLSTWRVFPNPASEFIVIQASSPNLQAQISLYNSLGQIVKSESLMDGKDRVSIPCSDLPKGMYVVELVTEQGTVKKKVIVE